MLGINPNRQLSATSLLTPFPPKPPVGQEKKTRKNKRKFMGQDKNGLISKGEAKEERTKERT